MATTLLDIIGLLLVAAGLACAAALIIGPGPSLAVAGVVVLAGSWLAARQNRPRGGTE